ncbi:MAG: permease [Opitutales bacterium]
MWEFIQAVWYTWLEMGPYLLIGFLIAGMLHAWLDKERVMRFLGKSGHMQTIRAVLLGIPIPVCSCGVIPISATLREKGAGPGATSGFMLTTPQTGIDSIYATWGILGAPIAILRVCAALVSGIAAGFAAQKISGPSAEKEKDTEREASQSCCGGGCASETPKFSKRLRDGITFALWTLPRDVFWPIVIGVFIAAAAQVWLPTDMWSELNLPVWAGYLFVMAISLPVYVCSTGAIPIAWALSLAGMSPGAVLIFLVAGPASNAGTFSMLVKFIGIRAALAALITLSGILFVLGISIDLLSLDLLNGLSGTHGEHMEHSSWVQTVLSLLAAALFLGPVVARVRQRYRPKSYCCQKDEAEDDNSCCHS